MASPDRKDLFPGALEMMVLRALSQEPRHGYALVQHIKRTSNDLLQVEARIAHPGAAAHAAGGPGSRHGGTRPRVGGVSASTRSRRAGVRGSNARSAIERMLEGIRLVLAPVKP